MFLKQYMPEKRSRGKYVNDSSVNPIAVLALVFYKVLVINKMIEKCLL